MAHTLHFQLFLFVNTTFAFVHPGLLVSETDITRIKSKLTQKLDPWQSSWDKLTSISYGQSNYTNNAVARVYRDATADITANAELLWHDAAAAFALGLRWKIERDAQYAEAAAAILTAWGEKLDNFDDEGVDDQYLTTGLQGHELVNAAELIRDYAPFAESGLATFTAMFERTFLAKNLYFLNHSAGSEHNVKHFFANWELCNMASVMAFGVLTDNSTLFDYAVDYFKTGSGNGGINNCISNLVTEPETGKIMGQPQEAGRDQGHTGLDFQLLGVLAQQAWNQGEDLYGFNNSKILLGAEYYARYNLNNDVPFEPYTNGIVSYTEVSDDSRGSYRPTWELLYAHYGQIKGVDAPWTKEYMNYTVTTMGGFEGGAGSWGEGSGHYDSLGWGSLLYHLDPEDIATAGNNSLAASNSTSTTIASVSASTSAPSSIASVAYSSSVTSKEAIVMIISIASSARNSTNFSTPTVTEEEEEDDDECFEME
ncbi:uncharacterized protein EAF02_002112 [Botrytis sinoallii]|uniref:uncharacterized protein n=1 Tax=Botrytis sinoallii TaxID=1463999 RepID=UPI001900D803|nr:uncharacterized protein EAF02_002112 [Botrytis sinoallii]KAF7889697.1 hypothetical protein EAF02_002112 [Botrytis sinoallii]